MFKITNAAMATAPIGVFGLIALLLPPWSDVLAPLAMIIVVMYLAAFTQMAVVYSASVKFLGKMSPIKFFKGLFPALLIAFSTCSSAAALPSTFQCTQEKLGVSKDVSSFVLTLGATVNSDGAAIYHGVAALFVAQVYGVDLTLVQQFTIVLTGTLSSLGLPEFQVLL